VTNTTRERILDTTATMFGRYGYTGTGLKQIVAQANAPFGSIYHFFPGGKEQLGAEVIRRSGRMYGDLVLAVWTSEPDPVAGVGAVFAGAGAVLQETDYADACPIATVALEVASANETLRQATADVFEEWIARITEHLCSAGAAPDAARHAAVVVIEALEGAFLLCRALRTTGPMDTAGLIAVSTVREALQGERRGPG
jgi:AcrR family transcriptional regulator